MSLGWGSAQLSTLSMDMRVLRFPQAHSTGGSAERSYLVLKLPWVLQVLCFLSGVWPRMVISL